MIPVYKLDYYFFVAEEPSWQTLTCWRARLGTGCSRMTSGEHRWRNVGRTEAIDRSVWPPFVWIIFWVASSPGATIWWMWHYTPPAPFSWSRSPERWVIAISKIVLRNKINYATIRGITTEKNILIASNKKKWFVTNSTGILYQGDRKELTVTPVERISHGSFDNIQRYSGCQK